MPSPRIAVIGAGTAGLATAIALADRGCTATVFERHAALAPVGAGMLIQPSGIEALRRLGAADSFQAVSVPVRRLVGISHRGWRLVDVSYEGQSARGVSRPAMTQVLFQRALAVGVQLRLGTAVADIQQSGPCVTVGLQRGQERFDAAVIASGSGCSLAVKCGLAAPASVYPWGALNAMFSVERWEGFEELRQRFRGPRKLFGLMPTGRDGSPPLLSFFWSLPVAGLQGWRDTKLDDWKAELLALWPESEPVVTQFTSHEQFSFATYRHAWPERLANGRICLVGDAAHAMSPQLGLGSTLAMGDALALASCLQGRAVSDGFQAYERARMGHVRRFQVLSRALTPCFQADSAAWWRDGLFAAGLRVPGMRWLMRKSIDA